MEIDCREYFDKQDIELGRLIKKLPRGWFLERADEHYPQEVDENLSLPARWCVFRREPYWHWTDDGDGTIMVSDEDSALKALKKAIDV